MSEISKTLLGLVSNYSPSNQESQAVSCLVNRMNKLGFDQAYQDGVGNAVGIIGEGPRQIVLLGHIDTVPGEIPVRIDDGKLYARGSVDAKGPLAAFTDAVACVGNVPGWQMIVIGAVCEETDSRGARYLVEQYKPDFAVIGEPSSWNRITLGYKGCAHGKITIRCERHHGAATLQTACEIAVNIWQQISHWTKVHNQDIERQFEQLQNSLVSWISNSDGFQDWASLNIEARLPLSVSPEQWAEKMAELVTPGAILEQSATQHIPAYRGEKNTPLVRSFLKAIRGIGGKPGFVVKTGTADMNIVGPAWQCPIVAYGPGDSSLDHTPDEHLVIEEYDKAVQVLKLMITELVLN